jgi:hypothetical protein
MIKRYNPNLKTPVDINSTNIDEYTTKTYTVILDKTRVSSINSIDVSMYDEIVVYGRDHSSYNPTFNTGGESWYYNYMYIDGSTANEYGTSTSNPQIGRYATGFTLRVSLLNGVFSSVFNYNSSYSGICSGYVGSGFNNRIDSFSMSSLNSGGYTTVVGVKYA